MSARRARLVDLNPRWGIYYSRVCFVSFDCPEGHANCWHTIPFTPSIDGFEIEKSPHPRGAMWDRVGDTFTTLTLAPSIRRVPVYENWASAIAAGADPKLLEPVHFCALHVQLRDGVFRFEKDSR